MKKIMAGVAGLAHILRARNFAIGNQLPSEDCLANCHGQFSPPTISVG